MINVERLSYYWAAEEIIPVTRYYNGDSIQDVGDSYIHELVRRNMVIAERKNSSLRFETCHLHDMMREICLSKAREENFLQIAGIDSPSSNSQSHCTSRRLVLHNPVELHVERDLNNPKLRSLLIIVEGGYGSRYSMEACSSFTRLQLLRVLDLTRADFKGGELPSSIGKLIHLRYLSLHAANVSRLPSSLKNLKHLIYLNIEIYIRNIYVPNFLKEMQELRYLALPWYMHENEKIKLEMSNLVKLEMLKRFSTSNISLEDLCGMVRLRNLIVIINDETSMQTLSASIAGLRHLECLSIQDANSNRMKEEGFVLEFINLNHLELSIRIPWLQQQLPSHLTYIVLHQCQLEEDPMPILEKLRHLEVLRLMPRSFWGRKMVCSDGGFPQLHDLDIGGLFDLEEWIIEEGSMPLLRTLSVHRCERLKELPDGLRFIDSLKNLKMDNEWEGRLSEGGEDYYKVKHIPCIKFGRI